MIGRNFTANVRKFLLNTMQKIYLQKFHIVTSKS